jgi:YHS domain-containing protein
LEARHVTLPCAVVPGKTAKIDKTLTARLNYEIFMFSGPKARQTFDKNPLAYCGLLTDPVTQKRFQPRNASPQFVYKDRKYFFLSDSTRTAFIATPDSFAVRRGM